MPLYLLQIKCDLENIGSLVPSLGNDKWQITLVVGCQGDEDTTKEIAIDMTDEKEELDGGGKADAAFTFIKGQPKAHITIVNVKKVTGTYSESDAGKYHTILGLECRGCVPKEWLFGTEFNAITSNDKVFSMIDLSDKDGWYDYDEDNDCSVSVQNFEYKFELSR